jgi:hypothetical protein
MFTFPFFFPESYPTSVMDVDYEEVEIEEQTSKEEYGD